MTIEEYERRILDHLKILWKARGTPQPKIAKALGLNAAQVSRRLNGHVRTSAAELMVVLQSLDADPVEFFAGVSGAFNAEQYLTKLEKEDQRRRKYAKSDRLRDPPLRPYTTAQIQKLSEGLEELRLVNSKEAYRQALEILRAVRHQSLTVSPQTECAAHVALGCVYRARGQSNISAFFLRTSLRIAGKNGTLRGRTLQAVMSLALDQGDLDVARQVVELALAEYTRARDWCGFGRALISLGIFCISTGSTAEAVDAYETSLVFVQNDRWYVRFAALHGLALAYVHQDEIDKALVHAEKADGALDSRKVTPLQQAAALWLRAEIQLRKSFVDDAATTFCEVLDIYERENVSDIECALICLRLAFAYQVSGRGHKIEELTARIIRNLPSLSAHNKLVAGSLAQLHGSVIRGELSTKLLATVYREALTHIAPTRPSVAHLAVVGAPHESLAGPVLETSAKRPADLDPKGS